MFLVVSKWWTFIVHDTFILLTILTVILFHEISHRCHRMRDTYAHGKIIPTIELVFKQEYTNRNTIISNPCCFHCILYKIYTYIYMLII